MRYKAVILATLATACGSRGPKIASAPMSIMGQDSTVIIDKNTPLNPHLKSELGAIGKMTGGCTAFHIGHGLVITAGHCLNLGSSDWAETSCHNLSVVWGQTLDAQNSLHSRCTKILQYQYDKEADFAILAVDPAPSISLELPSQGQSLNFSDQAIVIGYPKDKSLSSSGTCDVAWVIQPDNRFFRHHCDTLPGNSGSPILNATTAVVMGVHDGEANDKENYGSLLPEATAILSLITQVDQISEPAQHLQFGPFADKLTKNLVNFGSQYSATVSFDLSYDIEAGYDKLLLIDGQNRSRELSGQHIEHFDQLETPVSLVVLTDYSGASHSVTLSAIDYNLPKNASVTR